MSGRRVGLAVVSVALLASCALVRPRRPVPLVPVSSRELPALVDDLDAESLHAAVERTLVAYARTGDLAAAAAARRLLEILDTTADPAARRTAVARAFRVVRVRDPLLLTAYYEPELAGRLEPDDTYRYPLYARPPDLVDVDPHALDSGCDCRKLVGRVRDGRLQAYPTRGEIDAGALAGHDLELAWASDPIGLAVLHVQGSGRLRLPDGRLVGIRFAGSNGRPFRGLGQTLLARGLIPRDAVTLQRIRQVLESLPVVERAAVLATNERYTFFRLTDDDTIGSLGVALTPGRSIAADARLVPPGALAYLATPSVHRFVVSQDAGAAIVGAHADLFLGAGAAAEEQAGRMHERGELYLLLVR